MDIITINARKRDKLGTRASMRDRNEGRLPAVMYGHGADPMHLTVDSRDFEKALRQHARVFQLDVEGGEGSQALLKDLHFDSFGDYPVHADFTRLEVGEKVKVRVPLEFVGHAKGLSAGGRLNTPVTEIEVECAPIAIPETIQVVVNDLDLGDGIHVSELTMPEGVLALDDPAIVVCNVTAFEAQSDEPELGEEGTEPEVEGGTPGEEEGESA